MKHTLNPLAELIHTLAQIGRGGGHPRDRWILCDHIVAAGFPRNQAEEAIAEAFPYPNSPEEAYTAGTIWGSNYGRERDGNQDLDKEGQPRSVQWRMKLLQNPKWMTRFVSPLRLDTPVLDQGGNDPKWIDLRLDGVIEHSLRLLGVGGLQIHWDRIPKKYWTQFFAGVVDSTPIVLAGNFGKKHEDFKRLDEEELVLDADESALASAICGGIEYVRLCSSHHHADRLLEDQYGPIGVMLSGTSISWFFYDVMNWLHYSVLREEKSKASQFDSSNKHKKNTGIRLTKAETDQLTHWVRNASRKRMVISSSLLAHSSEAIIGRSISKVTAWKILKELELITKRTRKSPMKST